MARDRRRKVLTTKARCKVEVPLPCSFLTAKALGTPTNCQLLQEEWMGADSRLRCNGNSVLTDRSSIKCVHGGVIMPMGTSCVSKIGASVDIVDISTNAAGKTERGIVGGSSDHSVKTNNVEQVNNQEGQAFDSENEHGQSIYASHTMCDYENCDERDTCEYFRSQVYIEKDSAKLKENFQTKRKKEWDQYLALHNQKNMEAANGGWGYAAHHIISGKEVLLARDDGQRAIYGILVKLANYFAYDVDNEWNCIMLPTYENITGTNSFGEKEFTVKRANAYDAMWAMGRQWHLGKHGYSLKKDTLDNLSNYYKKHPEQYPVPGNPDFFSNYITAMKEEMDRLLMKYSRIQCWKKNYERKKRIFWEDMNGVSSKVEAYLLRFGKNPRMSFPFFVSEAAVEYAYDLPVTLKLVVVYQKGTAIRAKRIKVERYMKNDLKIVPIEKEDMEIKDNMRFIIFCENVMYFLIDTNLGNYSLPFERNGGMEPAIRRIDFRGEDVMKYLLDHGNEIVAFVNQYEFDRQPIARVVAMRGGM